ncbi:hypothetical protein EVAR_92417_1 [Eumeta japonica]|uniref:Uncharacterized protein n=1 Tax=Eumeta variegata TaxID=151549 RepID=A0A4C1T989_EUMVA|nr:hypothetical protein EVAR_92417_1 [Eumeta japonica]
MRDDIYQMSRAANRLAPVTRYLSTSLSSADARRARAAAVSSFFFQDRYIFKNSGLTSHSQHRTIMRNMYVYGTQTNKSGPRSLSALIKLTRRIGAHHRARQPAPAVTRSHAPAAAATSQSIRVLRAFTTLRPVARIARVPTTRLRSFHTFTVKIFIFERATAPSPRAADAPTSRK